MHHPIPLAVVVMFVTGCGSPAHEALPQVAPPLGNETVRIRLASCDTPLPPVVSDLGETCSPSAVGATIPERDVCRMLKALKARVESPASDAAVTGSDRWSRIRQIGICQREVPTGASTQASGAPKKETLITIEAVALDSRVSGHFFAELVKGTTDVRTGGAWSGR